MGNTVQQLMVMIGGDSTGLQSTLTTADKTLKNFGLSFQTIIGGMSFASLITGVIKVGETFEDVTHTVERATGATGAALEKLNDTVKNVYASTAQSGEAVAQAVAQISIRTGAAGPALEVLTRSALAFAKASGQDLKASVDENQKLFAQWTIATGDQSEALDMLLVASQRSGVSTAALGETMTTMGATLRGFGMSFKESLAFVGAFAKAGIDAADTTRGLNKVLKEAADSGKDPHEMLLGLIEQMKDAKTRADALAIAFGAGFGRSAAIMADAVRNGTVNLKEFSGWLDGAKGKAQQTAKDTESLGDAFTKLGHAMAEFVSGPGDSIMKFMTGLVDTMAKVFKDPGMYFAGGLGAGAVASGRQKAANDPWAVLARAWSAPAATATPGASLNAPSSGSGAGDSGAAMAAYTQKLLDAESALGLTVEKDQKLKSSLDLITTAYHAGTVGAGVYVEAIRAYDAAIEKANKGLFTYSQYQAAMGERHFPKAPIQDMESPIDVSYNALGGKDQGGLLGSGGHPDAVTSYLDQWNEAIRDLIAAQDTVARNAVIDAANMSLFGVKTVQSYKDTAAASQLAYQQMKDTGTVSAHDLSVAFERMQEDVARAALQSGQITQLQFDATAKKIKETLDALNGTKGLEIPQLGALGNQIKGVFGSLGNVVSDAIFKTKDLGKAFEDVGKQMVKTIVQDVAQMAIGKLLTSIFQAGSMFNTIGQSMAGMFAKVAAQSSVAAATAAATGAASRVGEVSGDAAVGAAAAAASTAAIPIVGPGLAPGAAAAMYSLIMGFLPLASFSTGGDVGATQLAMVHAGEHVLTPDISTGLRQMMARGGPGGSSIGGTSDSSDSGVHFHSCTFTGVTQNLVNDVMNAAVKQARRAGAQNL